MSRGVELDRATAEIARRQHSIVARRQLLAIGATERQIHHRLASARLHRVHAGVYAVGHARLSLHGRYMAAVLSYPPGAVLSHRSGAALLDLWPVPGGGIEVTISIGGRRRRPGLQVHRTRQLPATDVTHRAAIPVTSVARTLVDLAAVVAPTRLEPVIERAQMLQIFDLVQLEELLARSGGRRGIATLRALLPTSSDDPELIRSRLERRFLRLVEEAGLPRPVVNAAVEGYEVDFHWPQQRLIVETDGASTHATTRAFERDRERDLRLRLAGWEVLRFSYRQILDHPAAVLALLCSRLTG